MKLRVFILMVFILHFSLVGGQKLILENLTIHGSLGKAIGPSSYNSSDISDFQASLFSNMDNNYSYGFDFNMTRKSKWSYGLYFNFNKFNNWSNSRSNRFVNSILRTNDYGILFSLRSSKKNVSSSSRFIICPVLVYIKLNNPASWYNLSTSSSDEGMPFTEEVSISESYREKYLLTPGIFFGEEWSLFLSSRFSANLRLAINTIYTSSDAFPDKFIVIPSFSIGIGLNNSRNKWYFLK